MFGSSGFTEQDVESVMSACSHVTSFAACHDADGAGFSEFDSVFSFAPLLSAITSGALRSLVALNAELHMSDEVAYAMDGQLPCLNALSLSWPSEFLPNVSRELLLTSRGVAALINGIPSLTVFYLDSLAHLDQPFPTCRSGIRRLGLLNLTISGDVLHSMLVHMGSDLRTLSVRNCVDVTDTVLQCVADRCPHIEALYFEKCPLVTPACLPSIARLASLRLVFLDTDTFTHTDMDWLMQHTRSPVLVPKDYRRIVEEYGSCDKYRDTCFSFEAGAKAEGVDVSDWCHKPCDT